MLLPVAPSPKVAEPMDTLSGLGSLGGWLLMRWVSHLKPGWPCGWRPAGVAACSLGALV